MTNAMLFDTTPETVAAAAKLDIVEFKINHKRGPLTAFGTKMWDTRVVIKRSSRMYIEAYGKSQSYLINDWQRAGLDNHVHYRATRKEAVALAHQLVREGAAAGVPSRR
jgi:hypothetical protein